MIRDPGRVGARPQPGVEGGAADEHGVVAPQRLQRGTAGVEQAQQLGGHQARVPPPRAEPGRRGGEPVGPEPAPQVLHDRCGAGEQRPHDDLDTRDMVGREGEEPAPGSAEARGGGVRGGLQRGGREHDQPRPAGGTGGPHEHAVAEAGRVASGLSGVGWFAARGGGTRAYGGAAASSGSTAGPPSSAWATAAARASTAAGEPSSRMIRTGPSSVAPPRRRTSCGPSHTHRTRRTCCSGCAGHRCASSQWCASGR